MIYLGTFSKILSPGLRLGWAVAPRPVLEKLNLGKQGSDLCSSSVTQTFVAAYFQERAADGGAAWLEYIEKLRVLYGRRRETMLESLQEHFGEGARWTEPQGGLFIWATLDERIDTTDLLALARKGGVAFVPGPRRPYMDGRSGSSSDATPPLRASASRSVVWIRSSSVTQMNSPPWGSVQRAASPTCWVQQLQRCVSRRRPYRTRSFSMYSSHAPRPLRAPGSRPPRICR